MKAKITKVQKNKSKFGGDFFYVFFKDEAGKSYKTCLYPKYHNFARWDKIVKECVAARELPEVWLDNLLAAGNLVNADSFPKPVPPPQSIQVQLELSI